MAAAVLVITLGSATLAVIRKADDPAVVSTTPDAGQARAGVFSTPTETVLLFSDGIDGATAIDLDRRVAGRRVIEGERAGDQSFRLTLTGEHLVVGWGEIHAAPLAGGTSSLSPGVRARRGLDSHVGRRPHRRRRSDAATRHRRWNRDVHIV